MPWSSLPEYSRRRLGHTATCVALLSFCHCPLWVYSSQAPPGEGAELAKAGIPDSFGNHACCRPSTAVLTPKIQFFTVCKVLSKCLPHFTLPLTQCDWQAMNYYFQIIYEDTNWSPMTIKQQEFDLDHISESQPKVCPSAPDCPSALVNRVTGGKLSLLRCKLLSRCVRELLSGPPLSLLKPKLCSQRVLPPASPPAWKSICWCIAFQICEVFNSYFCEFAQWIGGSFVVLQ